MKKFIKASIVTIAMAAVFFTGTYTQAQYDWLNQVLNSTVDRVNGKAELKKNELVSNLEGDMGTLILDVAEPKIQEMEANITAELEAYYQSKLSTLTETDAYLEVETHLNIIEQQTIEQYKRKIDEAFGN